MLIALLAVLGVDLAVVVAFGANVLLRRRWVGRRPGAFKGAIRINAGEVPRLSTRWRRGYGRWVRDVLVWEKAPLLFRSEFVLADALAAPVRPAFPGEVRRLGMQVVILPALVELNKMDAAEYFARAAEVMKVNPPHASDFSQLARVAHLGIVPGQDFGPDAFDAAQLAEVQAGADAARTAILAGAPTLGTMVNGWISLTDTIGVYGNSYFQRAVVTMAGLGANPPEDAIYPLLITDADGHPLDGANDYLLHFDADQLPPVDAFWSVTMYDAEGFQVANQLDRYALGDRDKLTYNPDGSLDLYLQHTHPGPDDEPNWLPAPQGSLGVTLRLYAPQPQALDGTWHAPAVRKA